MKILVLVSTTIFGVVTGFWPPHRLDYFGLRSRSRSNLFFAADESRERSPRVVVVGKIILDQYGDPCRVQNDDAKVTIGGGGPQASWGACAGLAVRDHLLTTGGEKNQWVPVREEDRATLPPKQNVSFLAPIGLKNWSLERTNALNSLLPMLQTPPILVPSNDHITPTINIWHDENEVVNWMPVNGSFGDEGAGGLWMNRPSAQDILDAIMGHEGDVVLHAILEAGDNPTGKGLDALPFFNATLMNRVSSAGIEPIVFPDETTGRVSNEDRMGVSSLIRRVEASLSESCIGNENEKMLVVSPDRPCYSALLSDDNFSCNSEEHVCKTTEFAVRDGAKGSFVNESIIPPATLNTPDGGPINPTGAGNAYAGAYVSCRASGSSAEEAAILANAVGAVVCEYDNLPPWTWEVLDRVARAACEIKDEVRNRAVLNDA
mmetsp:Transcript_5125/g.11146  ORF Transcript_5125/g.11146 Transcript_5125/m.11146 type:complete len:433 (-) Transcript_5125:99-1397(-)